MRKTLAGIAVLGGIAAPAFAQSSVTLQIYVDASARATHNSLGTLKSLSSGNETTSRIVFRGSEDLGDGLRAGFWLESTVMTDTGIVGGTAIAPANQFFDRTAIVSLTSKRWGEIHLGREWNPVFLGWVYSDPFVAVGVGSAANLFSSTGGSTVFNRAFGSVVQPSTVSRTSNTLQYFLPGDLGGLNGQLMVAPGEGSNAQGNFRYSAGKLGYRAGPVNAAVYYGATRIDAQDANVRQMGAMGWYDFGVAKVTASVTDSRFKSSKQLNTIIGLFVPTGQHLVRASFNRADQRGTSATGVDIGGDDANQFCVGYEYNLSKRTALYGQVARVTNKGNARFQVPGGPTTGAIAAGSSSTGTEVGLRTFF